MHILSWNSQIFSFWVKIFFIWFSLLSSFASTRRGEIVIPPKYCNIMVPGPYSQGVTHDLGTWTNLIKHHFLIAIVQNDAQPYTFSSSNEFVIILNPYLKRPKTRSPTRLTWIVAKQAVRLSASHKQKTTYRSTPSQPVVMEREEESHAPQLKATKSQLLAEWEEESRTLQLKATNGSHSNWWEGPPTGRSQAQLSRRQHQLQFGGCYITTKHLPVATSKMEV